MLEEGRSTGEKCFYEAPFFEGCRFLVDDIPLSGDSRQTNRRARCHGCNSLMISDKISVQVRGERGKGKNGKGSEK